LFDGVLARKVVTTSAPGGGWKTSVQVGGKELKRWLEVTGNLKDPLRVRVEAELLEPEGASVVDSLGWESGAGIGSSSSTSFALDGEGETMRQPIGVGTASGGGRGLPGWELRANPTAWDETELVVSIQGEGGEGGGIRVVSDIDDTVKVRRRFLYSSQVRRSWEEDPENRRN
jgi:hypothetical protein